MHWVQFLTLGAQDKCFARFNERWFYSIYSPRTRSIFEFARTTSVGLYL